MELNMIDQSLETMKPRDLAWHGRLKFLIVEDDTTVQPIWEKIVHAVSPRAIIRWATTEEGAEKLIRERIKMDDEFDIVIVDIFLAGKKNGIDLWRRYGEGNSHFLFSSGIGPKRFNDLVGDWQERYPTLLQKPLDPRECVNSINAMLIFQDTVKKATSRIVKGEANET